MANCNHQSFDWCTAKTHKVEQHQKMILQKMVIVHWHNNGFGGHCSLQCLGRTKAMQWKDSDSMCHLCNQFHNSSDFTSSPALKCNAHPSFACLLDVLQWNPMKFACLARASSNAHTLTYWWLWPNDGRAFLSWDGARKANKVPFRGSTKWPLLETNLVNNVGVLGHSFAKLTVDLVKGMSHLSNTGWVNYQVNLTELWLAQSAAKLNSLSHAISLATICWISIWLEFGVDHWSMIAHSTFVKYYPTVQLTQLLCVSPPLEHECEPVFGSICNLVTHTGFLSVCTGHLCCFWSSSGAHMQNQNQTKTWFSSVAKPNLKDEIQCYPSEMNTQCCFTHLCTMFHGTRWLMPSDCCMTSGKNSWIGAQNREFCIYSNDFSQLASWFWIPIILKGLTIQEDCKRGRKKWHGS